MTNSIFYNYLSAMTDDRLHAEAERFRKLIKDNELPEKERYVRDGKNNLPHKAWWMIPSYQSGLAMVEGIIKNRNEEKGNTPGA